MWWRRRPVSFKEALQPEFKEYQQQVVKNAKMLAQSLLDRGFDIVSGGTDNHLMLVDLRRKNITGKAAEKALDEVGVTCNKNAIPFDPEKPFVTSGIRLGTPGRDNPGDERGRDGYHSGDYRPGHQRFRGESGAVQGHGGRIAVKLSPVRISFDRFSLQQKIPPAAGLGGQTSTVRLSTDSRIFLGPTRGLVNILVEEGTNRLPIQFRCLPDALCMPAPGMESFCFSQVAVS